ncbi:MAG: hypothetical protein SWQ30_22920 [Thermodesulfobacteriota bacterium]|nr:hypothetical protein [Thermodesulfobacteriota bacterium]
MVKRLREIPVYDIPPLPGQTCVVTTRDMFKRAALLFDRVHMNPVDNKIEEGFRVPPEIAFGMAKHDLKAVISHTEWFEDYRFSKKVAGQLLIESVIGGLLRAFSEAYAREGISVVPLYRSGAAFDDAFLTGSSAAYQAALNSISVVSEDHLTWEQVLEFRADKEAVRKYRSFRIWLQDGLKARSVTEATDVIEQRLYDYQWAIKKHGLKTVVGALSSVLDLRHIAAITVGAGISGVLGGPIWSAITAGLVLSSKIAVQVADRMIDLEDITRGPHSEVAIIYDIHKELKKAKRHK